MTVRLVIEHSPHPQPQPEMRHAGGDLTIGRGAECDWQIVDPDMFVSRRHCVVSLRDGRCEVTDASRGGLFVDGADTPLGAGNSARLDTGSRLRLGDIVIRVEIAEGAGQGRPPPVAAAGAGAGGFGGDDFFARPAPPPSAPPPRPAGLPDPFETAGAGRGADEMPSPPAPAPTFDDPFTLDPLPAQAAATHDQPAGFLDDPAPTPTPAPQPEATPAPAPIRAEPAPRRSHPEPSTPAGDRDDAAREAFLRGLGLDPADLAAADDMEAVGRRFRLLVEGLQQLLRTRAREKGSARVAQTVIGSADVNPLKFLATTDEVLAALLRARGRGYLEPDAAIAAAFRDLGDHQLRTWTALQAALRRMIDRFDPAAFEREVEKAGRMQALLAGGRSAKLWDLYVERYRTIAAAAEERFLGEVGADFRDAYEGRRRTSDD